MSKLRVALIFASALLCGCAHHSSSAQNRTPRAATSGDSEFTGIPAQPLDSVVKTPPRALPVALPVNPPTMAQASAARPPAPPVPPPLQNPPPSSAPAVTTTEAPDDSSSEAQAPPPSADSMNTPVASSMPGAAEQAPAVGEPAANTAGSDPAADWNREEPALTPEQQEEQSKVVVLQTNAGKIIIELDDFSAPKTCKNFRQLVADGFYNNTVFHRVIPHFIIQGGDPQSKSSATNRNTYGLGGPGYTLPPEIGLKHDRGAVAMARLPDSVNPNRESNGSQFYICLAPCPSLDDQYTVFGHVIKGMDVADAIANEPRDQRDNPLKRTEMVVSLVPKDQALGENSASNP